MSDAASHRRERYASSYNTQASVALVHSRASATLISNAMLIRVGALAASLINSGSAGGNTRKLTQGDEGEVREASVVIEAHVHPAVKHHVLPA